MQHERQSLRGCAKRPKIEAAFWWRNLCSPVPALLLLHEFRLAEDQNVTGSHRVTTGAALTDQKSWNLAICFGEDPGCPKCLRTGSLSFSIWSHRSTPRYSSLDPRGHINGVGGAESLVK
jgi:hypothetical protein